jgi:hypothetical protein
MERQKQNMELFKPASAIGRPRSISEGDVQQLVELFKKGYSVSVACRKARIARSTYYAEYERNEEFQDRVTAAQEIITNRATRVVEDSIRRRNVKTAMWWLDRMDRRERNAQRAKEYRLIKKLTVTKSYKETQSVELEIDTLT